MVNPDDIILFESGEWSFWGDLSSFEAAECESRDYTIVRFESAQWQELVRKELLNQAGFTVHNVI